MKLKFLGKGTQPFHQVQGSPSFTAMARHCNFIVRALVSTSMDPFIISVEQFAVGEYIRQESGSLLVAQFCC